MINTYPDPVRSIILGMPTWDDEVWDALQEKNFEKAGAAFEETLRNLTPEEWSSVIWSGLVRGWPILRGTLTEAEWDEQFLPEAALAILSVLSPGGLSDLYYSLEPDEVPMFHRLFLEVMEGDSSAKKAEWLKKGRADLYPFFAANAAGLHFEPSGRNLLSAEGVRRYAVLTPGLLETILSVQTAEITIRVAEQQKVPAAKIPVMADSLGSVILGLTPLKSFATELQKSGLDAPLAASVAKSLEERVLAPVRSEVDKMSAVGPTPLPKLAPVLPSSATGLPFGFGGGVAKAPAAMPSGAPAPMPPASVASPAPAVKSSPAPTGPVPVVIRTSPVVQPVATQSAKLGSGPGFNLKDLAASSASPTPARLEIGVPVAAPKPTVGRAESAPAKVVHYSQWSPASGPAPAAAPTKPAAPAAAPVPFADLGRRPGAPASASETIRPVSSPSAASQPLPGSPLSAKPAAPLVMPSVSTPPTSVPIPSKPALPSMPPAIKAIVPPPGSGAPSAVPVTAKLVATAPAAPALKPLAPPVPPPAVSMAPKPPAPPVPPAPTTASQPSSIPSAPVAPPAEKVNFLSRFGGSAMHSHSVPLPGPQTGASSAPKPPPSSGPVPKPEPKSGTIDLGSF